MNVKSIMICFMVRPLGRAQQIATLIEHIIIVLSSVISLWLYS